MVEEEESSAVAEPLRLIVLRGNGAIMNPIRSDLLITRGQETEAHVMIIYDYQSCISDIAIVFIIAFSSSRGWGDGSAPQGGWWAQRASE